METPEVTYGSLESLGRQSVISVNLIQCSPVGALEIVAWKSRALVASRRGAGLCPSLVDPSQSVWGHKSNIE
jgi:hypothetical protein